MKSNLIHTKNTLIMNAKVKILNINTIAPGFSYKNKKGVVIIPKTGILL